jgi:phosphoribosyl-ATP pyrophosphohydrolase
LQAIIQGPPAEPRSQGSYTNRLLRRRPANKIAQKVGEEAVEVIVAALGQETSRTRSTNWRTSSIIRWC